MFGYYLCLGCGRTHNDWFHGERLMVCNVCKSKESVRYNSLTKPFILNGIEMVAWAMDQNYYDIIREKVDFNPLDISMVKRACVRPPDLFIALSSDIDSYIKFAYHDFRHPQEVYDRYTLRNIR